MATGSCICGDTTFEINGDPLNVLNCHCGLCRKMNGAAFSTYVAVAEQSFVLKSGDLASFGVGESATKTFCRGCGTPIYNENPKYMGVKILHLGSLDDAEKFTPKANIYCDNQVDWIEQVGERTNFPRGPA